MISVTSERLARLRADARLERETTLERLVRAGQDPAVAVAEAPEIDEIVVEVLRDELLEARGQLVEFGLARLAARAGGTEAAAHRESADRVEFALLREIAEAAPELTVAVWALAGHD